MRHVEHDDRIRIETLYNLEKRSAQYIANALGFCERTIRNELKRGFYIRRKSDLTEVLAYSSDIAQADYDYKATNKGARLKLENDYSFVKFVEACVLRLGWSPDTILGFIRNHHLHFKCKVCRVTLYKYIDMGLFLHITNKDLLFKSTRKTVSYKKVRVSYSKPLNQSIDVRPDYVNDRSEFGHWELDTVVGSRKSRACLAVLTERKTRYEIILKISSKTQFEVRKALNRLEKTVKGFKDIFKTITCDNGCEFLDPEYIERSRYNNSSRTDVFYCHAYSSWERGSNENANKLIRRFIPKGKPIEHYSDEQIAFIQKWMNTMPRRILNYYSPLDCLRFHEIKKI